MFSLPLHRLTVVTREKARIAASAGLETVCKWLNCVACLTCCSKALLFEKKGSDHTE